MHITTASTVAALLSPSAIQAPQQAFPAIHSTITTSPSSYPSSPRARGRRIVLTKRQSTESPSGASSMPPRPTINLPQAYATSLTLDVRNVYAYKSQRPYCVLTGGYNSGSKPDSVPFPPMMSPPISFSSNTSSASSGDETAPPPVIRKKTGEIVKSCLKSPGRSLSCSNIPVSSPGLPYGIPSPPKFVHFGTELEQIRFFLQAETPVDVCRDAFDRSPEPIDGTSDTLPSTKSSMCAPGEAAPGKLVIKAVNGPNPMFSTYEQSPVVLETLILDGRTVRGTVKVHNIAYTKTVYARYTLNTWKTIDEVGASFQSQIASPEDGRCGVDRFKFSFAIPDAKLEEIRKSALTLSLCIRYAVAGQEFWDNNNGSNYCFCLFYIPTTSPAPSSPTSAASGFLGSRLRIRSFSDSSLPSLAFRDDQDDDYCYAADDDDDGAKIRTSMRRLKKDMVSPPRGAGGMLQPTQLSFLAPTKLKPAQKDASIASTTTATTAAAAAPESGTGNTATGSSSGKRSPSTQIPTVSPNDTRRYMQMSEAVFSGKADTSSQSAAGFQHGRPYYYYQYASPSCRPQPYSSAVTTFPAGSDGISALSSSSSSARPGAMAGGAYYPYTLGNDGAFGFASDGHSLYTDSPYGSFYAPVSPVEDTAAAAAGPSAGSPPSSKFSGNQYYRYSSGTPPQDTAAAATQHGTANPGTLSHYDSTGEYSHLSPGFSPTTTLLC